MASFIREEKVDLSKYLPAFLTKDPEFAAKLAAESAVHDEIRQELDDILNQFFVATATWGLTYWEDFLDLPHDETLTDADRRSRIIQKINGSQTVTLDFLTKLVNQYVADKSGVVTDHPETYSMEIDIPLIDKEHLKKMRQDIDTYIPAHIGPYYKEIEKRLAQQNMAMIKATTKTVDIYPASLEKIEPETPYYVAMAMTMTEELTLTIGGI